jgi:hypothetical protein
MTQVIFLTIASLGAVVMAAFLVALCRSSRTRVGLLFRLCQHFGLSAGHARFTSSVHKITSAESAKGAGGKVVVMNLPDPSCSSTTGETRRLRKAK